MGGRRYPPSVRRVVRMVLGLLVLVFDQVSRVDTGAMPAPQLTAVHLCSQPGSWWAAAGGRGREERSSTLLEVVVVVADVPQLAGLYYLRRFMFKIYNTWKGDFKTLCTCLEVYIKSSSMNRTFVNALTPTKRPVYPSQRKEYKALTIVMVIAARRSESKSQLKS